MIPNVPLLKVILLSQVANVDSVRPRVHAATGEPKRDHGRHAKWAVAEQGRMDYSQKRPGLLRLLLKRPVALDGRLRTAPLGNLHAHTVEILVASLECCVRLGNLVSLRHRRGHDHFPITPLFRRRRPGRRRERLTFRSARNPGAVARQTEHPSQGG